MEFHGKKSIFQRSAVRRQMSDKFETFLTLLAGEEEEEEETVEPDAPPLGNGRIKTLILSSRTFPHN